MADISLDDLIKKDKESKKKQPSQKKIFPKGNKVVGDVMQPHKEGGKPKHNDRPQKKFSKVQKQDRQPRQQRPERQQSAQPRPVVNTEGRKLKILGLHPDVTNDELLKLFMEHGSLEKCRIDQDDFGRSMTTATVLYREEDGARNAIQKLNKSKILNSVITVDYFRRERDAPQWKTKPIHKRLSNK